MLLRLAQAKTRLDLHHGSMAPLPRKTAQDAERVGCPRKGCSGSCPRWHLLRACQPGSDLPRPTCRVCGEQYNKPKHGDLLAYKQRQDDAHQRVVDDAAANTRAKQQQQRRKAPDGKQHHSSSQNEQFLKAENARLKKEIAFNKKEHSRSMAADNLVEEEQEQPAVDAEEELTFWTQAEANYKLALARGFSTESREALQTKLAEARSMRTALEQKRDEAKPYSSKVQRAEAEEQKAKKLLSKVEVKLEAAYESLSKQMQAVAKLKDEKQQCEQAVAEATKQVECYRNSQQQESASPQMDDLSKLRVLMQHIQAAMQTQMQQELPQNIFETAFQTLQEASRPPPPPPAAPEATAAAHPTSTSAKAPAAQPMDVDKDKEKQTEEQARTKADAEADAAETAKSTPDFSKVDLDEWMRRQPQEPEGKEGPERDAYKQAREEWVASALPAAKKLRQASG